MPAEVIIKVRDYIEIQMQPLRLNENLLYKFPVGWRGHENFVSKRGKGDLSKFSNAAQHSTIAIRVSVQEAAENISELKITLKARCQIFCCVITPNNQSPPGTKPLTSASGHVAAFRVAPSRQGYDVHGPGTNDDKPRYVLVS
jgi:hypothetical protein